MTTSNVLSLPFRRTTRHTSLAAPIQQYISQKYDQHPDMFRADLEAIDGLRRDAANVLEAHPSGLRRLQAYAAQLVWLGGKFPVDLGAEFTWYPALGYHTERPVVENNLGFELINVLYNIAALHSQLSGAANRAATDGLKTAIHHFSAAAGVLTHIRSAVLPGLRGIDPPDDMDADTLDCLVQLLLAQAQECFWQKAVMDGFKDATIAKLAAHVSDLYSLASEAAVRSQAISRAWIHHLSAKHHHFAAAAQYRAACDCLEKRRYGEEVARLQDAVNCVNEGLKETRGGYISKAVADDLQGLRGRVEEDLKRAEKDNDLIYLQAVPPKPELRLLERSKMAVARVPDEIAKPLEFLSDGTVDSQKGAASGTILGPALFTKLVPFAVHSAVTIYEERRDRLVSNYVAELEQLNQTLHEVLSSLGLPGSLQALEKPLGLPGTLKQHAEELRQAHALERLDQGLADVEKLRNDDRTVFEEGKAFLAAEEEEDLRLQRRYGTQRWTRPESRKDPTKDAPATVSSLSSSSSASGAAAAAVPPCGARLWQQVGEIEGYLASSTATDAVVRDKLAGVRDALAVLSGHEAQLLDRVPQSRGVDIPDAIKPALGRMRSVFADAQRLESRRRKKADSVRALAHDDDVQLKQDILAEAARLERLHNRIRNNSGSSGSADSGGGSNNDSGVKGSSSLAAAFQIAPAHFEGFFDHRLSERYETGVEASGEREAAKQEHILAEVRRANREFEAQRRRMEAGGAGSEREKALQWLDNAYYKYKEIVSNIEVGRKFYNDLSPLVGKFRDEVRLWVGERRREARGLEQELDMPPLSSLSLNHQYQQQQPAPPLLYQQEQQRPRYQQQQKFNDDHHNPPAPLQQWPTYTPAEAQIQSWASEAPPQQPKPLAPVPTMGGQWMPTMGIRFAPSPGPQGGGAPCGTSQQQTQQGRRDVAQGGTWDPSSRIRFG